MKKKTTLYLYDLYQKLSALNIYIPTYRYNFILGISSVEPKLFLFRVLKL